VVRGRPFVILKTAVSFDGFAGRPGERVRLTGPAADRYFHRQRAEVDAIAAGSTTVLSDDPELTARGAHRFRPLPRVIVDWRLRVPPSARVFSTLDRGPVIMVVDREAAALRPDAARALEARGAAVMPVEGRDLGAALARLATRGILSLLVEAGPSLFEAFAGAGAVDRVQWVVAPRDLGWGAALKWPAGTLVTWDPQPRLTRLGDDVLIECDVHRTD
jgi:diaminohydroxyphosphoribosylaminopyrimidine deaminase/5-amino-6-(5-phosphoribosylamino)uracil reductase